MRLLLIEDEPASARAAALMLSGSGFNLETAVTGEEGLDLAHAYAYDAILLDLNLEDMSGLDVLRELRRLGRRLPVVILSARDDVVSGLDLGADDYVRKPFRFEELLARIRARLRPDGTAGDVVLRYGDLELDLHSRRARVDGREVDLSAREFTLLDVFLRHRGQVLSQEQLLSQVWGYDFDPGSNVVEVYVSYLRRKLGRERIQTVRGMGYALHA